MYKTMTMSIRSQVTMGIPKNSPSNICCGTMWFWNCTPLAMVMKMISKDSGVTIDSSPNNVSTSLVAVTNTNSSNSSGGSMSMSSKGNSMWLSTSLAMMMKMMPIYSSKTKTSSYNIRPRLVTVTSWVMDPHNRPNTNQTNTMGTRLSRSLVKMGISEHSGSNIAMTSYWVVSHSMTMSMYRSHMSHWDYSMWTWLSRSLAMKMVDGSNS